MRPQPMLVVHDVPAASRWYQQVLGLRSAHGGKEYERLTHNGRLVMQLHRWDVHEHPHLGLRDMRPYGNGVLLWFECEDFDLALARIEAAQAEIVDGPLTNSNAGHREVWVRDPNGYVVVVAG